MNEIIIKRCIVCEKTFLVKSNIKKKPSLRVNIRNNKCLTCSPKCSKIYKRIQERIYSYIDYDKKKKVTGKHQCSCKKFKQKQKEIEK